MIGRVECNKDIAARENQIPYVEHSKIIGLTENTTLPDVLCLFC